MRDPLSHWTFSDVIALAIIAWTPFIAAGLAAASFVISFE